MITGVGLFSTFSGTMAAMLLSPHQKEEKDAAAELLQEIKALRAEVRGLQKRLE
jgi:hypothetical protein